MFKLPTMAKTKRASHQISFLITFFPLELPVEGAAKKVEENFEEEKVKMT